MSSFEIKGKIAPCTLFRPLSPHLEDLTRDVEQRLRETPEFFRNMAIIIDCAALGELGDSLDLHGLVHLLREHGLMPVGIQGGNEYQKRLAPRLSLCVFPDGKTLHAKTSSDTPAPCPAPDCDALVMDKPVRSGQQIYAKGRDLIITAQVGPGAEVIADGNIHIYAPLRGRALAGAMGNEQARIFCKELKAELVSIAGLYQVSEDLPHHMDGPVQIRLAGRQLLIEPL
ncbi:septum site-determining protein MinC [Desulfovibrionales bacterium]